MKKFIILLVLLSFSGCAHNRSYLPHIPKNVEIEDLEVNINSPWGGSTVVKAKIYRSTDDQ